MRRVLEIPEIIEQILSYLENKEKLAIALTLFRTRFEADGVACGCDSRGVEESVG